VANGLQLFYVLPCYPPFAPDTLDERLAGLAVGGLLLTVADRLLWPDPGPPPRGERLAAAAEQIAAYAAALRPVLQDPGVGAGTSSAARAAALHAADRLRLTGLPAAQRPLGPGVRDRGLLTAGAMTRVTAGRLASLADLLAQPGHAPHPRTADLVAATGDAFATLAAVLRSGRPVPVDPSGLDTALDRYLGERGRPVDEARPPADLRAGLAAVAMAEDARVAVLAAGGFLGAPPPDPAATPGALWFRHAGWFELVWRCLAAHLTPRSVYLQNPAEARAVPSPDLHRLAVLLDHAFVQLRTEPGGAAGPDWLVALAVVHRIDDYASVLGERHAAGPPPPPDAVAAVEAAAVKVAGAYSDAADAVGSGEPPRPGAGARLLRRLDAVPPLPAGKATPCLLDAWGWLHGLAADLERLEQAFAPRAAAPAAR
jgi:hypothetical protein